MKKVFSSLLLIFVLPFRQFKKIFKDNFLSGLILGAIFSLVVNVVSMQIQGKVEKQRVLEAIENEIVSNTVLADEGINMALRIQKEKQNANPFISTIKYSRDLWEQSVEPLQYVAQLNAKIQILINSYYGYRIPVANHIIDISNKLYLDSMKDCFNFDISLSTKEKEGCNLKYYNYLSNDAIYVASDVSKDGYEILKIFHPTQDRLNSPILRFLMGSESMRILSGK